MPHDFVEALTQLPLEGQQTPVEAAREEVARRLIKAVAMRNFMVTQFWLGGISYS